MSVEDFREDLQRALQKAVAAGVDPDDLDTVLDDAHQKVEQIRAIQGDA